MTPTNVHWIVGAVACPARSNRKTYPYSRCQDDPLGDTR